MKTAPMFADNLNDHKEGLAIQFSKYNELLAREEFSEDVKLPFSLHAIKQEVKEVIMNLRAATNKFKKNFQHSIISSNWLSLPVNHANLSLIDGNQPTFLDAKGIHLYSGGKISTAQLKGNASGLRVVELEEQKTSLLQQQDEYPNLVNSEETPFPKPFADQQKAGALSLEVESLLEAGCFEYSTEAGTFFCTEYVGSLLSVPAVGAVKDLDTFLANLGIESNASFSTAWSDLLIKGKEVNHVLEVPGVPKATWVRLKAKAFLRNDKFFRVVGALQNVTECVETERRLVAEKAEAEKEVQNKTEFVSFISHEIRTPLNAILGFTYLLQQEKGLKAEQLENLNSIHFSSQNLLSLVNNTLDYSKIEAGKVELEKVNFHLKDVINNTYQALKIRAADKKIGFELKMDPDTPEVVAGDPVRLNQILNNLLSNSIKFTECGGITLGVEVIYATEHEWVLELNVADTGIGIPLDKQSKIFDSFSQVNSSTHRLYGGTGLGLTITKKLVALHKGTIQVKSEEGEGSVFTVRLRYVKPQASLISIPQAANDLFFESQLNGKRILVVDDNEMNNLVATKLLGNWQVAVDTAKDGNEALEKIQTSYYDLVLLDLNMPVLNGFQTIAKLKELGQKVPVIALTANSSQAERELVIEAGAKDYITKPFVPQELYSKLVQHINSPKKKSHAKRIKHIDRFLETKFDAEKYMAQAM